MVYTSGESEKNDNNDVVYIINSLLFDGYGAELAQLSQIFENLNYRVCSIPDVSSYDRLVRGIARVQKGINTIVLFYGYGYGDNYIYIGQDESISYKHLCYLFTEKTVTGRQADVNTIVFINSWFKAPKEYCTSIPDPMRCSLQNIHMVAVKESGDFSRGSRLTANMLRILKNNNNNNNNNNDDDDNGCLRIDFSSFTDLLIKGMEGPVLATTTTTTISKPSTTTIITKYGVSRNFHFRARGKEKCPYQSMKIRIKKTSI